MNFSIPDDKTENAKQSELLKIFDNIICTADEALTLYTCDIMRHSSDDEEY